MSVRKHQDIEPEKLSLAIPKRRVRIGASTQALIDMEVNPDEPLFFALPEGETIVKFSSQIGSWIAVARKENPGSSYAKRMLDFAEGEGIGVWRTK